MLRIDKGEHPARAVYCVGLHGDAGGGGVSGSGGSVVQRRIVVIVIKAALTAASVESVSGRRERLQRAYRAAGNVSSRRGACRVRERNKQ